MSLKPAQVTIFPLDNSGLSQMTKDEAWQEYSKDYLEQCNTRDRTRIGDPINNDDEEEEEEREVSDNNNPHKIEISVTSSFTFWNSLNN